MEFCNRRELVNVTGHDVFEWSSVVAKELIDNSLDDAEEAEIAPVISVAVEGTRIIVQDNGRGIPAKTILGILDYSKRVSSREAYCSPARGAQGNALSSILPMGYVLDAHRGEKATGATIIELHGVAHDITFNVDHVRQEPKITHTTRASSVVCGTRITVDLPAFRERDIVAGNKTELLALAEAYAWLNPHLSLRVTWNGEAVIDATASNPNWRRWSPAWPTSAHWYDEGRLRRYMAAHIANRGDITVREFISELRGMSSTAKQKLVLAETGASHRSLHDFFGLHKANTDNIGILLASLKRHTKPVPPAMLGIIGKAHLYSRMEQAGGDPHAQLDADADGHDAARRVHVRHQSLFDRTARLFRERDRMLDIEPRQQQGEFLAAIPGDDQSLIEGDQRQSLADRTQAGVALHVAIAIIEQLK